MQHFLRNTQIVSTNFFCLWPKNLLWHLFYPLASCTLLPSLQQIKNKGETQTSYFYFLAYLWSANVAWWKISLNTFNMSCSAVDLTLRVITTAWQPRHKAAQFFRWAQDMMVNILQAGIFQRPTKKKQGKEGTILCCVEFSFKIPSNRSS